MTRWPNPPPKGVSCDASVPRPEHIPPSRDPVVYMCQEKAVETLRSLGRMSGREVWLCARHVQDFVRLGYGYRNPKKYPEAS